MVRVEVEAEDDDDWRYHLSYTDGFRELHYPPPPPPLLEKHVDPSQMRLVRERLVLSEIFDSCGGAGLGKRGWKQRTGWDRTAVADLAREARPFYEDIDQWDGVCVTSGRLSHVLLECNKLVNRLPASIWTLDFLVELKVGAIVDKGSSLLHGPKLLTHSFPMFLGLAVRAGVGK